MPDFHPTDEALPAVRTPRVKGQAFLAISEYVALVHGGAGLELLRNTLSPAERVDLDSIGWGSWRPFDLWQTIAHTAALLFGGGAGREGQMAFIERAGSFGAERDLTVVRRMLLRVASPALLIERAPLLWRTFNNAGNLTAKRLSDQRGEAELHGWPTPDAFYCAINQGWMQRYLEMCGAREVIMTHTECQARDDQTCRWLCRWRDT